MVTRILYTHSASLIGGGNQVLLSLFRGLDRTRFQPISVIPESGPLEQELRRLDVPYFIADLRPKPRNVFRLGIALLRLNTKCFRYGPTLLHGNDPFTYRGASVGLKLFSLGRVCHIHHPGQTAESLRWALRCVPDVIVTPSVFMSKNVSACLDAANATRVEPVWNSVDVDWFHPADNVEELRKQIGLAGGKHVSILGALAPHKGHVCFLRMAQQVARRIPDTTFHIVGSSKMGCQDYAESLSSLARELGIADRVRFWGFVEKKLARDILAASDLFVLPTCEEGFGLAVAESQACGVPVLTSARQPLDEVVDDGRTGHLLEPEDFEAFTTRAVQLLERPEVRAKMGTAGREWVVRRFSPEVHVNRIMSIYEELQEKRRKGVTRQVTSK
jgi:glycosyltransferase involved in cell wall biosynthesis